MTNEENSQAKSALESAFVAGAIWAADYYGKPEVDIAPRVRAHIEKADKERQAAADKYDSLLGQRR